MTPREREILEIIRKKPTIEQSELAEMLGITRSSVAVHIANLQKKGCLLGRGYIVNEGNYVVGIGAANVDVHGRSKKAISLHDSNPGHMNTSSGGVTRNVSENFARLGGDVKLITAVGDDVYADKIMAECISAGIDMSNILKVKNHASSTYISVLDEKGDMFVALSDMSVLHTMSVDFLHSKNNIIKGSRLITCDPGLPPAVMEEILNLYSDTIPIFVDTVSKAYASTISGLIGKFHTAKPNLMETEALSGMTIRNKTDLHKAADKILDKGLKRIFVSLGADGCLYMDRDGNRIERKLRPVENMVNATGAGDAFTAALIYSYVNGFDIDKTIDYALAAGVAAVSHERTINPNMSVSLLEKILKERRI